MREDSDTLVFTPTVAGATLALESDSSGLLTAAGISTGAVGLRVNPDASFNASGVGGPLFDPGLSVRAGQFTVNGVAIDVAADDSVSSVLAKITASSAGVTASFDSETQTVRLVSTTGSEAPALVGDTSGFLAAVKLDADVTRSTGQQTVSAFDVALGSLPEYAGVRAGSIVVNGREIAVDPAATTVRGLVAAIGDAPGVRATLDQQTGRLRIVSTRPDESISLSDSSGVLATLGIITGTYAATPAETRTVTTQVGSRTVSNADKVAPQVEQAVSAFNSVLSGLQDSSDRAAVAAVLERALTGVANAGIQGLTLGAGGGRLALTLDRTRLERSLGSDGGAHSGVGTARSGGARRPAAGPCRRDRGRRVVTARRPGDQRVSTAGWQRKRHGPGGRRGQPSPARRPRGSERRPQGGRRCGSQGGRAGTAENARSGAAE